MPRQPGTPIVVATPAGPGHVRFVIGEGTDEAPHWLLIEDQDGGWWAMIDPGAIPAEAPFLH